MARFSLVAVALSCGLLTGCGGSDRPSLVKVTGTILLDGKPLEGAQVALKLIDGKDPKFGRPSHALTNAQGEFTPGTYGTGDGLPVGKYKVGVQKTEYAEKLPANFDPESPAATPVKVRYVVPKAYSDINASGLTLEVTSSGMNPPELKLETGGAAPVVESTAPTRRANDP